MYYVHEIIDGHKSNESPFTPIRIAITLHILQRKKKEQKIISVGEDVDK